MDNYNWIKIDILEVRGNTFSYKLNDNIIAGSNKGVGIFEKILHYSGGQLVNQSPQCVKSIWLVIHPIGDFLTGQRTEKGSDCPFFQNVLSDNEKCPIIHFATTDIFVNNLFGRAPLHPLVPRLYQIIDNSIWNFYVPLLDLIYPDFIEGDIEIDNPKKGKQGKQEWTFLFRKALNCIDNNYKRGLYHLEVSHEYADLNARLVYESFLAGAHASGVAPFIFHSEGAIKRLIKREFNQVDRLYNLRPTTERIAKQNWRILLVDDRAKQGLGKKGEPNYVKEYIKETEDNELPWNCKIVIIKHILKSHFCQFKNLVISQRKYDEPTTPNEMDIVTSKPNEKNGILIEYVETLEGAKTALKTKKYDIILLDYLLDSSNGRVCYGYELLDDINRDYVSSIKNKWNPKYKLGPHERLFFIFISAYSSAVYERLLAEGLNRSEKYWHIAVGACPTNTPKLFLYNLLKLMEKQLADSGVDKLSVQGIYNVVNRIFGRDPNDIDANKPVRYRANKYYQEVLDMHYLYHKMLKDVQFPSGNNSIFDTKGSVLITNFISKNTNLGGLLEHLTQLVHLTAFGTVRQWPEMWEEYIYFKAQFDIEQFKKCGSATENYEQKFNQLCIDIENHIIQLKSDVR